MLEMYRIWSRREGEGEWKAPPDGMYKINWDVAIDSKNMCMGIGIIVRDCEGQLIAAKSQDYIR